MERHSLLTLLFGLLFAVSAVTGLADTPNQTEVASPAAVVHTPRRGATMTEVEQTYGAPLEKLAPVGNPPISRWKYPDFTVYFEHQYVIHAVVAPASR
jgi:hypothetical protein